MKKTTATARLSISTLISFVLAFTTAIVIALFGFYNYQRIKETELKSLKLNSEMITNGIAKNIAFPLYNLDDAVAKDIIKNAMANQSIYAIVLLSNNQEEMTYGVTRDPAWRAVQLGKIEDLKEEDGILRKIEIKHESESLGYLDVYFTQKFLKEKLQRHLVQTLAEILLLTAILTVINILLLRKLLIHPIKILQGFAEEIKTGNLDAEVGHATFVAELAALRKSLKEMADELLYSLIKQIRSSGIQVKTSATEIFASARQLEGTISEQATSTTQVTATSNDIAGRSQNLAETMNNVMAVTRETVELAGEGRTGLQKMQETMQTLIDATSAISSKLSIIDKKADNISNIVVAINKIAEQTNLLSLNAAVEAEKAGEYGRGFSVVAREIRRLSDQTEISTSRIAKVVEEMQSAVSSGVMEMDKFVMRVNQSVGEMGGISARLVKIIEQVGDLFPRYEEVNEAMQAQSSGAIEISKAMGQLSEISGQTRESLQEFHKAAMHLTNAVEELQAEISQFKVSH